jgi:hypothetical protein
VPSVPLTVCDVLAGHFKKLLLTSRVAKLGVHITAAREDFVRKLLVDLKGNCSGRNSRGPV